MENTSKGYLSDLSLNSTSWSHESSSGDGTCTHRKSQVVAAVVADAMVVAVAVVAVVCTLQRRRGDSLCQSKCSLQ